MSKNPFKTAEPVARKLKVLLYGPAGSGKTTAALTFPNVAIIDTEGGTDLYAGRDGFAPFDVLRAKTLTELDAALSFIRTGKHDYETLVIDSVTVLYEVAREALARGSKSGEMSYREWGKLNTRMESLYNALTDMPVHVVLVTREAVEYEGTGDSLKKVGTKPDADKSIVYNTDIVVRMQKDRSGVIEKSRGQEVVAEGQRVRRVNWDVFAPLAAEFSTGATITHGNKAEAVEAEIEPLSDMDVARAFVTYWRRQGLSDIEILNALQVERVSQFVGGRKAADAILTAWHARRAGTDRAAAVEGA